MTAKVDAPSRWRSRGRALEAASLVAAASAAQRWIPMRRWVRVLGTPAVVPQTWVDGPPTVAMSGAAQADEGRVARAVAAASRRLPWTPTCLAEATAAQVMLRRRGRAGVVVVGLRRPVDDDAWDAHAWLVGRGGTVTGGRAAAGFTATTVYEAPGGPTAEALARTAGVSRAAIDGSQ